MQSNRKYLEQDFVSDHSSPTHTETVFLEDQRFLWVASFYHFIVLKVTSAAQGDENLA